ncbi:MAG: enoyl-CoA hydratase/isomerase family protein [Saprospiraceae bacterium]|nr:enoyl-CoA hydratase/isomerase family protein [Saprospiraceae bacterium]
MDHQGTVECLVRDQVSWITFSHPKHNSMSSAQLQRLSNVLLEEGSSSQSKVIVLQSAGDRTFCAGANFDELLAIRTMEEAIQFFQGFAQLILAIAGCEKLVIGRVQGKAVGGGVGVLAAMDYCMATQWASVRLSELSIGIGPYVIEPAILRKIGRASFTKLALNPQEWQTADWAREEGLYQDVFEDNRKLDIYLKKYLQTMTSYSYEALKGMKQMLWQGAEDWSGLLSERAKTSARLLMQEETRELLYSVAKK